MDSLRHSLETGIPDTNGFFLRSKVQVHTLQVRSRLNWSARIEKKEPSEANYAFDPRS